MHMKYEYFENRNYILGQTTWLLHSFLTYLNTKSQISPEGETCRAQILSVLYREHICYLGNVDEHN